MKLLLSPQETPIELSENEQVFMRMRGKLNSVGEYPRLMLFVK